MKKKFFLFTMCLFVGSVSLLTAQEKSSSSRSLIRDEVNYGEVDQTYNNYEINWKQNNFKDNWTVTIAGGAQMLFGEDDSKGDFVNRFTFAPQISLTKYFRPTWGLRLNITGGSLHGYNDGDSGIYRKWNHGSKYYLGKGYVGTPGYPEGNPNTSMLTWDPQWNYLGFALNHPDQTKRIDYKSGSQSYQWAGYNQGLVYMQRIRYVQANIDFMFDLLNTFKGYNPKRFFEITPYGGIGIYNALEYRGNDNFMAAGVHGGFLLKFRVTERLGIHADLGGSLVPDDFDGQSGDGTSMNGIAQTTLGVAFKLGKTDWDVAAPPDYELINRLNKEINDLRTQLEQESAKQAVIIPAPPVEQEEKKEEVKFLPDPVFFKLNKAVIDNNQWERIDKAAVYLTNNPSAKVVVTGYADKETGTASYNMKLSERRAKAVADALVQRYGINPMRVSVNWSGSQIQPFQIPDWNRVVIFVIE